MSRWKVNYYGGDGVIEITIRDNTGKKIDKISFNQSDKKTQRVVAELLFDKYGINLAINPGEHVGDKDMFEF